MQPVVVGTARQCVAAPSQDVQAGAPRDEKRRSIPKLVDEALEEVFPLGELVELIEDHEGGVLGPGGVADGELVLADVPVEVDPLRVQEPPGESRLPDLSRVGEEDELLSKVLAEIREQITHMTILKQISKLSRLF
jgi:hypothetical protein